MPALAKPLRGSAARARARAKRRAGVVARPVYEAVTVRDKGRCRACGAYAGLAAHRHHLQGRTSTTLESVCLVCPECHGRLHVRVGGKTLKIYGDANVTSAWGMPMGLTVEMLIPGQGWVTWCDR